MTTLSPRSIVQFYSSEPKATFGSDTAYIDTNANIKRRYFQDDRNLLLLAPWLGASHENSFLNAEKLANEPRVLTYRDIKLLYEPDFNYEPIINKHIEHFDGRQYMLKILIILFVLFMFLLLLYKNKIE